MSCRGVEVPWWLVKSLLSDDQSRICSQVSASNGLKGCEVTSSGSSFSGDNRSRTPPRRECHQG